MWLLLACASEPLETPVHPDRPEHSSCPGAEVLTDEVCLDVVEEDGRYPTVSENRSGNPVDEKDPRLVDEDYVWLTEEVEDCTCVCCHASSYAGPGVYLWDVDFGPVWLDSMNSWSLNVFSGEIVDETQNFVASDPERFERLIEKEKQFRRDH